MRNNTYRKNNREKIREYERNKKINDLNFKIKKIVSLSVFLSFKKRGLEKGGALVAKYLPYTIQELILSLESKFEWWMTWNNYGTYVSALWVDNDSSTWRWNIDHIIPHSFFNYQSMEDESFKKCWALENLRPYSAKQNIIDGNRR